jgi:hypothetical protein
MGRHCPSVYSLKRPQQPGWPNYGSITRKLYATTFAITVSPYIRRQKWHGLSRENPSFIQGLRAQKSRFFRVSKGVKA